MTVADPLWSLPRMLPEPEAAPWPSDDEICSSTFRDTSANLDESVSAPSWDTLESASSLQLEKRGVTSHRQPKELWRPELHHKATVAGKLAAAGMVEEAIVVGNCHTRVSVATCTGCHKVKRFLNRCDRFYCPACQPRLANERRGSIEWWTNLVSQPKHVVLTTRNTAELTRHDVQHLRDSFSRLRRMKATSGWRGGFYSIECTNEGRGWHLHIHALVDARWIDARELSVLWDKATRGRGCIVKVKDCRGKSYLQEVTKYAVKGTDLAKWPPQDVAAFVRAFLGVRTFGVFGTLYGKRTEWRAWLESIHADRSACECGCTEWKVESELEYEWRGIQNQPRPPPACRPLAPLAAHAEFLGLIRG